MMSLRGYMLSKIFKRKKTATSKKTKAAAKKPAPPKSSSKPTPKTKMSHQKILTAEGWKRLMMSKSKKKS